MDDLYTQCLKILDEDVMFPSLVILEQWGRC